MGDISLTFKFELENGEYGNFIVRDVSEDASAADIKALATEILTKNTKLNGQSLVALTECTKSTLVKEVLDLE